MNKAKWIIGIIATLCFAYFFLIESINNSDAKQDCLQYDTNVTIEKRFDKEGRLKADVEIVNGLHHGVAHNYYPNGNVHSEIHYKNDKKDGQSIWFYEDGKPFRISHYVNGKLHGNQTKYYSNGKLMAEIPYNNNNLQPGTQEYDKDGNPILFDANFDYKIINNTSSNQNIIIEIRSKKIKKVTEYMAFMTKQTNNISFPGDRDDKTIRFQIPSKQDEIKDIEVTIWLKTKTNMNNPIVIEKKLPLVLGQF